MTTLPVTPEAAAMLTKAHIDRLALSARVLEGWEAMGGPMGSPAELLRMIENEIAILAKLRAQAPAKVDDLVTRYGRLAEAMGRPSVG